MPTQCPASCRKSTGMRKARSRMPMLAKKDSTNRPSETTRQPRLVQGEPAVSGSISSCVVAWYSSSSQPGGSAGCATRACSTVNAAGSAGLLMMASPRGGSTESLKPGSLMDRLARRECPKVLSSYQAQRPAARADDLPGGAWRGKMARQGGLDDEQRP